MPGYLEDVGVRASTTEGRKQRKLRAESRMLMDIYKEDDEEYPEWIRKRPAGCQMSHAAKAKAAGSSSAAGSSHDIAGSGRD